MLEGMVLVGSEQGEGTYEKYGAKFKKEEISAVNGASQDAGYGQG